VPELPEVETTRRGLAPLLARRTIRDLRVHDARLRWPVPPGLAAELRGQRIHSVGRRAKYLLLTLDRGTLILHLGMSGSLRVLPASAPRLPHDHLELLLDDGRTLRLNDPRRFGCCLYTTGDPAEHKLLRGLAPEPFDAAFTAAYLHAIGRGRRVTIKQLLMNGRLVTGVGNIYASEALFRAGVRPGRAARSLTRDENRRLWQAIRAVLRMAIRAGGTTLRDYVNPAGTPGYFRQKLYVYERSGQPCRKCGTAIRALVHGQRSTYYCPQCQQ
jgi:formamidopyrimidine-DNA glycosylase